MRGPDGKKDGNKGTMGDTTVVFHELATGQPRCSLGKSLSSFAFSSDGRSLLSGGPDGTVHLWDIVTGAELAKFTGHTGSVNAVAFSPLGKTAASISDDCTGLVWDISKVKRPAPPTEALKPGHLEKHWQTLAETDAAKAWATMGDLIAAPKDAVAFLKDRLKPAAPPDLKRIANLVRQLDAVQFEVRDTAAADLLKIGDQVVPRARQSFGRQSGSRNRAGLQDLRGKLTGMILQGEGLRAYRASWRSSPNTSARPRPDKCCFAAGGRSPAGGSAHHQCASRS